MNLKYLTSILLLHILSTISLGQVIINQSSVDFSLRVETDSTIQVLTFWKNKDSSIYTSVKYTVSDFNAITPDKSLCDQIKIIDKLWRIAEDSINMELNSFNIGYPLEYRDVLNNHIRAFIESENWQNHVTLNGKKLNYEIIKTVMLNADVYKPLNDFLKTKGYFISGFETEKHGFVTKENLQKAGFLGTEIIPMPFMVWITLSKL